MSRSTTSMVNDNTPPPDIDTGELRASVVAAIIAEIMAELPPHIRELYVAKVRAELVAKYPHNISGDDKPC